MKRLTFVLCIALIAVLGLSQAYAGLFSVFEQSALSGKKDKGALEAYAQYGQSVGAEAQSGVAKLKVQDIFRDGMQTKISFIITNIDIAETDRFSPEFRMRDSLGNVYDRHATECKHDRKQRVVSGVVEFEPIADREITSLELFLRENSSNLEWSVAFNVDPRKVGPQARKYSVGALAGIDDKVVEIVEIVSTPSMARIYLNSEVPLYCGEVKSRTGNTVAEFMQGFAPLKQNGNWTHEWTFNPIPPEKDLVLVVQTTAGETLEIPFKL
ncbi:MAG: DUF4179 domain-containing protein [Eubacteriales bacterium]|nr:DUF4179 domain-containing protein [Bacillota bacterium]MBV1727385.1 DUF4179 domain-containing protein [Desulforudis sp.]MDP3051300.1 DUF4179 domain-containing protein [Eubacteriales bacterium]MDQ7790409.1 DUF4179 domain-containing protein [Clostridia bacterium]MBU4532859.1 DUF4179 domain-containing protein [Bacillota bacterium]